MLLGRTDPISCVLYGITDVVHPLFSPQFRLRHELKAWTIVSIRNPRTKITDLSIFQIWQTPVGDLYRCIIIYLTALLPLTYCKPSDFCHWCCCCCVLRQLFYLEDDDDDLSTDKTYLNVSVLSSTMRSSIKFSQQNGFLWEAPVVCWRRWVYLHR